MKDKIIVFLKKILRIYRRFRAMLRYHKGRMIRDVIALGYRRHPLQDKIVIANFNGRGFGCNPKYIALELLRQKVPYEIVWLVNDMDTPVPEGIRKAPFDGPESYYELATARVIINNVKGDLNWRKRKGQYYIETWHGGFSFKLVEKDAMAVLPRDYISESKRNSRDTDLMLSGSKLQSREYRRAFWCTCEILERGLPRNDAYYNKTPAEIDGIRKNLGLGPETKVAMYAPTFRTGADTLETYGLDMAGTLKLLRQHWGGEWVLLFRHHPNLHFSIDTAGEPGLMDVSEYPDMQELVLVSDVLITDYSTTIFDAACLNKTILLFAADLEEYRKLRGLHPIYDTLPYPIGYNNAEFAEVIRNFDREDYTAKADKFLGEFGSFEDGHASEAVVQRIRAWMEQGKTERN